MRLDQLLVNRGLARSRAAAVEMISAGQVTVAGVTTTKPSKPVPAAAVIAVAEQSSEVSRAARKLSGMLDILSAKGMAPNITGKDCLDVGASTGGFTQVLLAAGAKRVIALDVGYNQLRPELRADPRVIVLEKVNARYLTPELLPFNPQIIVADVSFISLTMIIPALATVSQPGTVALLLIKPQFEVGRSRLGKGGIVRNQSDIDWAISAVLASAAANRLDVETVIPSPITGESGNQEYFLIGRTPLGSSNHMRLSPDII